MLTPTSRELPARRPLTFRRPSGAARNALAAVGAIALGLVGWGVAVDFSNFDRTRGGYEAPYTEYTGTPIDFSAGYQTKSGIFSPGVVVGTHLNCTTGMVSLRLFGQELNWRKVSPRAIAIHGPRQACEQRGFSPQF